MIQAGWGGICYSLRILSKSAKYIRLEAVGVGVCPKLDVIFTFDLSFYVWSQKWGMVGGKRYPKKIDDFQKNNSFKKHFKKFNHFM